MNDEYWMQKALECAHKAEKLGEVPVGAVIVINNECIAEGWNQPISSHDASAHAEMITIRCAGEKIKNYRLTNSTLYVTLEPCAMCAGAIIHARINRVVIGTRDPKSGAVGSVFQLLQSEQMNHQCEITMGVLQHNCAEKLQDFFKQRRIAQ